MFESIRKFGLRYCDLQTMLWNVDSMLRPLTLRIDTRNQKKIPIWFYILTVVCAFCYFYVYLISMAWFVFIKCAETGDILSALIVVSLGFTSEIGTVKLICMFLYSLLYSRNLKKNLQFIKKTGFEASMIKAQLLNIVNEHKTQYTQSVVDELAGRNKIRQIVSQCLASDALVAPNSRFFSNLLSTLKNVKRRAMIFWVVIIGNGVVYIVKPILLPGRHVMEDIFIIYGLEPMFESPNYEIAFIVMSIGVCVTVYLPANITAFLIIISGYIEAQMLAWSEELLHLWEDAEKHTNNMVLRDEIKNDRILKQAKNAAVNLFIEQRLKVIITGHATNISLLRQMEDVFRGAIAIEFTLLIIGLIAELLGGLENTYIEVPYALMQVAMDCLTGQRLTDASTVFERAVYGCKWENFDARNMKIVMVMLQNSQKAMTLSAGGVTMLNFVSLMSVIRSIYSAYTTLRTTMK